MLKAFFKKNGPKWHVDHGRRQLSLTGKGNKRRTVFFSPSCLNRQSPTLARVVPAFDVVKDIRSRLGPGPVLAAVDPLSFQHPEETLRYRPMSVDTLADLGGMQTFVACRVHCGNGNKVGGIHRQSIELIGRDVSHCDRRPIDAALRPNVDLVSGQVRFCIRCPCQTCRPGGRRRVDGERNRKGLAGCAGAGRSVARTSRPE